MHALEWIRSKATVKPSMADTIEYEGANYRSEWRIFRGAIPYRMRKELSGSKLENSEFAHESLRIICTPSGHQTGEVEYSRTIYTKVEEPAPASNRPGDYAAIYAEETGCDYSTALVHCNMD